MALTDQARFSTPIVDTDDRVAAGDTTKKKSRGDSVRDAAGDAAQQFGRESTESLSRVADDAISRSAQRSPNTIPSYKRGGTMRKSGIARLHKGERIKKRGGTRG